MCRLELNLRYATQGEGKVGKGELAYVICTSMWNGAWIAFHGFDFFSPFPCFFNLTIA